MKKIFIGFVLFLVLNNPFYLKAQNLIPFQGEKELYGFKNKNTGEIVIPAKYMYATPFRDGLAGVAPATEETPLKWGYIDESGKEVIPAQYADINYFQQGLAAVRDLKSYKSGFINRKGETVIPFQFDDAFGFDENGLALVSKLTPEAELWGFINKKGEVVVPLAYDGIVFDQEEAAVNRPVYFYEGLALFNKNGKLGYLDKTGVEKIPAQFLEAGMFDKGVAIVADEEGFFPIDVSGKALTSKRYDRIVGYTKSGLSVAVKNDQYGVINKEGKEVIPLKYNGMHMPEEEDLIAVKSGEKYGFINHKGEVVIPLEYDFIYLNEYDFNPSDLTQFHDGLCAVKKGEKFGYIDASGKTIIPFKYDGAMDFKNGVAQVLLEKGNERFWALVDKTGKELTPFKYSFIQDPDNGYLVVTIGHDDTERYGVINLKGEEVVPVKYRSLYTTDDPGVFRVKGDGENEFYINQKRERVAKDLKANQSEI